MARSCCRWCCRKSTTPRPNSRSMFGGSEININFPKIIPVHLTYQTAFVDDDGKLQLREDVYGRDAKHARDPQEQRAQGRRYRRSSARQHVVQAGSHAGRQRTAARAAATAMAAAIISSTGCSADRRDVPTRRARCRPIRAATATAVTARARSAKDFKQRTPAHHAGVFFSRHFAEVVQAGGLEPPTSGSTDQRSNQLSYACTGSRLLSKPIQAAGT